MSRKIRLSKQQQRQIDRRRRVHSAADDSLERGIVVTHHGHDLLIEDAAHQLLRGRARRTVGRLTTGDRIRWRRDEQDNVVIEQREDRRNLLIRPDAYGKKKMMAANIDQVLVVTSALPWMNPEVVERTLVAVLALPATPVIVLNKADLLPTLPESDRREIEETLDLWTSLGFEVIRTSVKSGEGIESLRNRLREQITLTVGLSGVGKTSLTREITPKADQAAIGEISAFNREGTHTTRASTLYRFPDGDGGLIDAPGVRDFPLETVPSDALAAAFPEITDAAAYCRFNDCRHLNEPGCAVREAAETGEILPRRLAQYQALVEARNAR
ncbi:ribosome small subunit-dependent GTPase A [Guyparkeria hydrothermalis]|uniref:ribosome small subunit-dependent GTPase A n=1 Tax=Guyparkeria hydrothermalis TaxID=923 RepID=UPI0020210CEF|nr:ribosome small subunit-dependent GTPase A [Guyparkeria hydrothermalis]MCL7743930.1 ribosome small subunit-dependent GTPase A [Guyparkeria hydrothermalis]